MLPIARAPGRRRRRRPDALRLRRAAADPRHRERPAPGDPAAALRAPAPSSLASDAAARAPLLDGIGEAAGVDLTDGVRMTLASGDIVHLRMSGNAPELRCYAEAADAGRARELVALILARVAARLQPAR